MQSTQILHMGPFSQPLVDMFEIVVKSYHVVRKNVVKISDVRKKINDNIFHMCIFFDNIKDNKIGS